MFLQGRSDYSTPILIDQDVDYYGFLTSQEFKNLQDYVMQYMPMDVYVSPYFGQGNGAYRELDRVYEAYKSNLPITTMPVRYLNCPPGTMIVDGVCVGVGAPTKSDPDPFNPRSTTSTINPMLILAAAAAFFIGS